MTATCRVVFTIGETNRRGFAYGTRPGHPESGEEAFLIERTPDDIWLSIRAVSRPARLLPYLGGPLTRMVQDLVTDRYITAGSGLGTNAVHPARANGTNATRHRTPRCAQDLTDGAYLLTTVQLLWQLPAGTIRPALRLGRVRRPVGSEGKSAR